MTSTAEFVDDSGAALTFDAPPTRVVCLVPSLTEAIAMTVPGVLFGATDWCVEPPELDVMRLGGTKNPDIATILDLAPDLVVVNEEENRKADVDELRDHGLPVWATDIRTVDQATSSIVRLLDVLGVAECAWLDLADAMWASPEQVDPTRRLTALVPIWRRPWMALGSDTYAGDVLRRLGVDTVFANSPERYPRFDPNAIEAAYDLVILPDEPYLFTPDDGPETFPGVPVAFVNGRCLTWYGPTMVGAPRELVASIRAGLRPAESAS